MLLEKQVINGSVEVFAVVVAICSLDFGRITWCCAQPKRFESEVPNHDFVLKVRST